MKKDFFKGLNGLVTMVIMVGLFAVIIVQTRTQQTPREDTYTQVSDSNQIEVLPVKFESKSAGGYVLSGKVNEFDETGKTIRISGTDGVSSASVDLICGEGVEIIVPGEGTTGTITLRETWDVIKTGDQFFGKCDSAICQQLVDKCMLIQSI